MKQILQLEDDFETNFDYFKNSATIKNNLALLYAGAAILDVINWRIYLYHTVLFYMDFYHTQEHAQMRASDVRYRDLTNTVHSMAKLERVRDMIEDKHSQHLCVSKLVEC